MSEDKLILLIALVKLYELKGLLQSILFANKIKRERWHHEWIEFSSQII